jgi:putative SOS response-associated peptidase YedK
MCGRFGQYGLPSQHKQYFNIVNDLDDYTQRFNIAPSQSVPIVKSDEAGNREFLLARWGLIPSWVKDTKALPHPINAKAETAAIKPMFRQAFRKNRILVPADAFYEWTKKEGKQPYLIRLRGGDPMGIGGLLESWHGPDGEITTFTILTTEANPLIAKIHDRMPVIIQPENFGAWLDHDLTDVDKIQELIRPYPERLMETYPISRSVNNPKNDSADLIEQAKNLT